MILSVPGDNPAARSYAPALRGKSIWVRPNAPDTPHFEEDLAAICGVSGVPD